jgi:CubicO group peptidase (beta-lactamase class C family)
MRRTLIAGLALVAASSLAAQRRADPLRGFAEYVEKARQDWGIPGVAVAVVRNDSVVFAQGFGVRRLGDTARVTPRTIFAIASMTKAFTAATLAMLVDSGKVKWDDPVTHHLRGFQLFDPYATRELTIRDLLSHRSGLARGDALWWATSYDRAEVLRRVRYLEPSWSFRSAYGYQNIMFLAAGQIVPAVTGTSWDDFVTQRIFTPLGMTSTTTSVTALPAGGDVASPHDRINGRMQPIAYRNVDNIGPAGSINSTVLDVAQWVRLQLDSGRYQGRRLIGAARFKEMWSPQSIVPIDTLLERLRPSTHFQAYGMGWALADYRGRKLVSHSGALDGMRSVVLMVPEERVGVVVLTNGGESGRLLTSALAMRVADAALGAPARDWSKDYLDVRRDIQTRIQQQERRRDSLHVTGTRPSLDLARYAGTYTNEMYGDVTVALDSGSLVLRWAFSIPAKLAHWHYDTFRAHWDEPEFEDDMLTFVINGEGKVARFSWPGMGDFTRKGEN